MCLYCMCIHDASTRSSARCVKIVRSDEHPKLLHCQRTSPSTSTISSPTFINFDAGTPGRKLSTCLHKCWCVLGGRKVGVWEWGMSSSVPTYSTGAHCKISVDRCTYYCSTPLGIIIVGKIITYVTCLASSKNNSNSRFELSGG